jgi:hypothetical protein
LLDITDALVKSSLIFILPILVLSACSDSNRKEAPASDVELRQKLIGTWRGDSRLPGDIHVQSETVVDSDGGYVLHLTNILADRVQTTTIAGTLQVRDGLLIDTITNDLSENTRVPRVASVTRIIRVDEHELAVRSTNDDETITYQKDTR